MKSHRHTTWQRIVRSPIVMIVVIVVCIILAKADWNIHEKMRTSALRLEQSQSELTKLQARQAELSGKVAYLSNDQGVESELRTKYLAVRQGESVDVIVDADQATTSTSTIPIEEGWFTRFLHMFGL
ncbi:MAG: hypothetical protein WCG07_02430 [Candidatus Taylorbacteria bacterium]